MRLVTYIVVLFSFLALSGCAYKRAPYLNEDLTKESWPSQVDTCPDRWTQGASRWFLTGDPNATEERDRAAPYSQAISTTMIRVADCFTNIKVDGAFQVQIFGAYDHNSVYLYGPNADVREVEVRVVRDTLYIRQSKNATPNIARVIIRVGILNLNELAQVGPGSIEGRMVRSNLLNIYSSGKGNIYLSGNVNLRNVMAKGYGSVNVFGAMTPNLTIKTLDRGSVNVSGNLGVSHITHHGSGDINLIGVNSKCLKIYTDGQGKIGLNGRFSLNELIAKNRTEVYGYNVASESLYVYMYDKAKVGLAGFATNLSVDAANGSNFGGKNLHAYDAYARARDAAHININAQNKLFASASQNSSIYFFGNPRFFSQFVSGNGLIIPVWGNGRPAGFSTYRSYKGDAPNYKHQRWASNYKGY